MAMTGWTFSAAALTLAAAIGFGTPATASLTTPISRYGEAYTSMQVDRILDPRQCGGSYYCHYGFSDNQILRLDSLSDPFDLTAHISGNSDKYYYDAMASLRSVIRNDIITVNTMTSYNYWIEGGYSHYPDEVRVISYIVYEFYLYELALYSLRVDGYSYGNNWFSSLDYSNTNIARITQEGGVSGVLEPGTYTLRHLISLNGAADLTLQLTPVPLPAGLPLFLAGLAALGVATRRRPSTFGGDRSPRCFRISTRCRRATD